MNKLTLLSCLILPLQMSISAHAENWHGFSLVAGTKSAGAVFDQYNDFFPGFWGVGAHQFYDKGKLGNIAEAHIGIGSSSSYFTFGAAYSAGVSDSTIAFPFSIGGSITLDRDRQFTVGPHVTVWPSEKSTKTEIGLKITYYPSGLRAR